MAWATTLASMSHFGVALVLQTSLVVAVLCFLLISYACIPFLMPFLVPFAYWLDFMEDLTVMEHKAALEGNSKACIILHSLSWEVRTIRIITIRPGLPGDSVIFDLHIGNFEAEEYEALSYVWGPADLTRKISISGKPVYVTDQLYHAIKHLRY